ncbi:dethiobiotin synthase [Nitriliruptor alkaliphilus]|uniref:dethiobiotin synthase n=1 Tax=Nitriliruptor alkaliphilus TaxID=427918 RepID=UPI0006989617|nr:dethiobiotin synthase [Nitriliruptor alkaliphilus]
MNARGALAGRTGFFVTGTDTGIGKTVVAAALCRLRADLGREVVYVKPVQSGAADGDDDAADVGALADVTTVVGPVVGPSLAPGVAVRLGGAELTGAELLEVVVDAAAAHPDADLVVEGAGGLLVELGSDGTTCADLAAALGLPMVVVARSGLGTLNHTALTLEAAAHRDLEVAGVVVSGYPTDPDEATRTNLAELQRASGRLIGVLPVLDLAGPQPLADVAAHLGPELGGRRARP